MIREYVCNPAAEKQPAEFLMLLSPMIHFSWKSELWIYSEYPILYRYIVIFS